MAIRNNQMRLIDFFDDLAGNVRHELVCRSTARNDDHRIDLQQRNQGKSALGQAWMRHHQRFAQNFLLANRIGYSQYSLAQLKIMQEAITLSVFVPFAMFYMKQPFKLDYVWAALCLVGAVYFIFRS